MAGSAHGNADTDRGSDADGDAQSDINRNADSYSNDNTSTYGYGDTMKIARLFLFLCAAALLAVAADLYAQPLIHGGVIGYGQNNPAASPTLKAGQSYPLRMDVFGALIIVTPTSTVTPTPAPT